MRVAFAVIFMGRDGRVMATTWWVQQKELEELRAKVAHEHDRAELWKKLAELRITMATLWRRESERLGRALRAK